MRFGLGTGCYATAGEHLTSWPGDAGVASEAKPDTGHGEALAGTPAQRADAWHGEWRAGTRSAALTIKLPVAGVQVDKLVQRHSAADL